MVLKPKRCISLLLALVLLVSMIPTAYATETIAGSTSPEETTFEMTEGTEPLDSTEPTEGVDPTKPTEPTDPPVAISEAEGFAVMSICSTQGSIMLFDFADNGNYTTVLNSQVSCTYKPNGTGTTRTAYIKNLGWHFARYGGVAHPDEPLYCIEPWRSYGASTSGNSVDRDVTLDGSGTTSGSNVWYALPAARREATTFLHAKDLLYTAKTSGFDITILDIEMEPPTGFDIAKELIAMPNPPIVIFATKSNAYTLKGYGVAIRYLQKPVMQGDFFEAMDAAVADATAHRLTFQMDTSLVSVHLRDVQYIETFGHYAIVHTAEAAYRFRSTLKEVMSRLPKGYFASPHKSYVVNLEHIRSATASEITLDCGTVVPIGRKRMQEFNDALYRFLGR